MLVEIIKSEEGINIDLPIYAQEKYLVCNGESYGWFVSSNFILPFVIYRIKRVFTHMIFTTEVIERDSSSIDEEKKFLNEVVKIVKKEKMCDVIYKPQPSAVFRTYPDGSDFFEWGSYALDIEPTMEEMLKKISSRRRSCIRKMIREGVKVEEVEDLDEIFDLLYNTIKRQGISLLPDRDHLLNIKKHLYPNNMRMYKATLNGQLQGVSLIYFANGVAFYELGGTSTPPYKCSMSLLILEVMLDLYHNHNVKTYDFVGAYINLKKGSKEDGIQEFKKRFGSYLRKGYQFTVVINPLYYKLYNIAVKVYFKSKGISYIDPIDKAKNRY
jgi:hypothetical protein